MLPAPARDDAAAFAVTLAALADPERYRRLDALEQVWKGTAYDGRPSWWDATVPLAERAPCVVDPIARRAGRKLRNLVFGEGRFPALSAKAGPADVEGLALADAEAAALTAALERVVKQAQLRLRARQMLDAGLMCGTSVTVCMLRAGRLHVQVLPAKWCTPEFDPADPERVTSLDVRYRYAGVDPETGRDGHLWYRRLITETADVTFAPVACRDDGREPAWTPDPAQTFATEFCAVDWHRNLPEPGDPDALDGAPLCAGLEGEMECRDFALSQRHRNGRYNGEPQIVLAGGRLPEPDGRTARPPATNLGTAEKPSLWRRFGDAIGVTKKAPGKVWELKEGASAAMLESTGAGATILGDDAEGIERVINNTIGIVDADPSVIGAGDLSSKALHLLFADMLGVASDLRECWGAALVRVAQTLLRLLTTDAALNGGLKLAGARDAGLLLRRFRRAIADGTTRWFPPPLELAWGPYFEPSAQEIGTAVDTAQKANGGRPVMTLEESVKLVAETRGASGDLKAQVAQIEAEEGTGRAAMAQTLGALGGGPPGAHPSHPFGG